jgi:hypothetical protein
MRHRRWGMVGVGLGVVLMVGSVAFRVAAAPALVRFPANVDETAHYRGTALTFVDRKTLLPLARPATAPVDISRRVKVVSSTFGKAVADEIVTVKTGGTTTVETYQYVIDRRSMAMVSDPRQIAFGNPKATMNAAGTFRVSFAMGTKADGAYRAFIPEENAASHLVYLSGPHYLATAHTTVIDFASNLTGPVAPYYRAHLAAMGLPMQITGAQLEPQLLAAGINVYQAIADVGPHLTPAGSKLISRILSEPVKLDYYFISQGTVSIEPTTGAIISVHSTNQGVAVKPDLSGVGVLQPLLNEYQSIPSVKALSDGLAALAARPPQLAETYRYTQTPASSLAAANVARDHAQQMNLVNVFIPWAVGALGCVMLAAGLIGLAFSRRRRGRVTPPETASVPPNSPPVAPDQPVAEPTLTKV